jgi:hypothetical protein
MNATAGCDSSTHFIVRVTVEQCHISFSNPTCKDLYASIVRQRGEKYNYKKSTSTPPATDISTFRISGPGLRTTPAFMGFSSARFLLSYSHQTVYPYDVHIFHYYLHAVYVFWSYLIHLFSIMWVEHSTWCYVEEEWGTSLTPLNCSLTP